MATSTCGPSSLPPGDDSQSRQLLAEAASELAGEGDGPESMSAETQTALMADAGVQYAPPAASADPAELAAQLASAELAEFLEEAVPRCEAALQQNELLDALADELAALAEDEGEAGLGPGASAGSRSPASGLTETHTFSDLVHSKGCTLAGVAWHPGRRGVVAVSCTQQPGAAEPAVRAAEAASSRGAVVALQTSSRSGRKEHGRAATGQTTASTIPAAAAASTAGAGSAAQLQQPPPGCILVWSQSDAIHPDLVLQPPAQALAMAFDPSPPHSWLAAGLSTGQVALFNLQRQPPAGQAPAGAAAAAAGANAAVLPSVVGEAREDASRAAPLAPAFVSSADACHLAPITDLHWLPGVLVTRDGQLEAAAAPAATGGTAPMGAPSDGAATAADAAPAVAAACNLFATTSADGSLLVWDARISTRPRNTRDEEALAWKPALALGPGKPPLMATRFCPAPCAGPGRFLLGSLEGELALAEAALSLHEKKQVSNATEWMLGTLDLAAGHTGRVLALTFSPFLSDILLVVGDSGFSVWRLAAGSSSASSASNSAAAPESSCAGTAARLVSVFESPFCADALYTCGCWSPSKPGVVVLGRADGRLEAWDLLDRCHQPAIAALVAPCAITTLAASPPAAGGAGSSRGASGHHQLLAVGDAAGTLRMLELPRMLRRRCHAEAQSMAALLAREQERLGESGRRAEARAAQARAAAERERAEAAAAALGVVRRAQQAAAVSAAHAGGQGDEGEEDSPEAAAERRYLAVEAEWRERLLGSAGGVTDAAPLPLAAS